MSCCKLSTPHAQFCILAPLARILYVVPAKVRGRTKGAGRETTLHSKGSLPVHACVDDGMFPAIARIQTCAVNGEETQDSDSSHQYLSHTLMSLNMKQTCRQSNMASREIRSANSVLDPLHTRCSRSHQGLRKTPFRCSDAHQPWSVMLNSLCCVLSVFIHIRPFIHSPTASA